MQPNNPTPNDDNVQTPGASTPPDTNDQAAAPQAPQYSQPQPETPQPVESSTYSPDPSPAPQQPTAETTYPPVEPQPTSDVATQTQPVAPNSQGSFQQPAAPSGTNPSSALAIASLVLGILGLLTGFFYIGILFGLVAVGLGAFSLMKHKGGKGMAIAGIITGGLGLLGGLIWLVLTMFVLNGMQEYIKENPTGSSEFQYETQPLDDSSLSN